MDSKQKNKNITKFQKIALYFFFYALIGWICEELYALAVLHTFVKRGFLFGPICPIYGYGAIILILCFKDYKNKPVKLFFLSAIVFSVFEYITDFFLQALFGTKWWDYTGEFLNLNGRITLSFSFVWGLGSLIFIKYLHPFITKLIGKCLVKIPTKVTSIFVNTAIFAMILDTIISTFMYIGIFN